MDQKLVAWARAVKSRSRWRRAAAPPLWLFSDPGRMPDLVSTVAILPRGLCGVVFRHDAVEGRAPLARAVEQVCRQHRLAFVVAGQAAAGAWAGKHLRQGRGVASHRLTTSSAHDGPALLRARSAGAAVCFLSPAFPTLSHPGRRALGPLRWALLARRMGKVGKACVFALGGIDGVTVRRLPRWTMGAGAIGALGPG